MKALLKILPLNITRKFLLQKVADGAFKKYMSLPFPSSKTEMTEIDFLVLDFETTGLNFEIDSILSIGYTVIRNSRVILKENCYQIVRQKNLLQSENVAIHQITDTEASKGVDLKIALDELLVAMSGKVLVAHHSRLELGFLNKVCRYYYGYDLPVKVVDTQLIEKKRLERRHSGFKANQLRLFNIRKAYGLPRYKAHNALQDAVATAELLLAMQAKYCGDESCRLSLFLR